MKNITLNETELLMLNNLAHGMNMRKFAKEANISEYKIYKLSKNLKERFKAKNMVHVVALATEYGIIG